MTTRHFAILPKTPGQRLGLAAAAVGVGGLILLFLAVYLNGQEISRASPVQVAAARAASTVISTDGGPLIGSVSDNASDYPNGQIPKYEKFEATFTIGNIGTAFTDYSPFNPNLEQLSPDYYNKPGILVDAILTSPSGQSITWPCFWYEGSDGWKGWKLRFAPVETGTWSYRVRARHSSGESTTSNYTFTCADSSNYGFIGINRSDPRFFQFSDGTPFYPIGCDATSWPNTSIVTSTQTTFARLKAVGGNYSRIFASTEDMNLEPYCIGSDQSVPKALCNYDMSNARTVDTLIGLAKENGIYMEWLMDDWTRWKWAESQYIRYGSRAAPSANYEEAFDLPAAREIYKRKIRYMMARWGYSTNILNFELLNETYADPSKCDVTGWHKELGDYIQSFKAQPHLASSSNGSFRLRTTAGIPWNTPPISYVNFHAYAIPNCTVTWTTLEAVKYQWEKLGSTLTYPWMDAAVWVDRTSRVMYKAYKWNKPLIWSEYGLISIDSNGNWHDWYSAYKADTQGRHNKDAIWAAVFSTCTVSHWKGEWVLGRYDSGPDKFWVYAPPANFLAGEDFTGLKQETAYPVSDPLNTSPQLTCSNPKIMAMSLHGPTKAYLYVKNLTDCWYRLVDPTAVPTPTPQTGTVTIQRLQPGDYTLEMWSTTETDPSKQKLSTTSITVGADRTAIVNVSLGIDAAYKLKKS